MSDGECTSSSSMDLMVYSEFRVQICADLFDGGIYRVKHPMVPPAVFPVTGLH